MISLSCLSQPPFWSDIDVWPAPRPPWRDRRQCVQAHTNSHLTEPESPVNSRVRWSIHSLQALVFLWKREGWPVYMEMDLCELTLWFGKQVHCGVTGSTEGTDPERTLVCHCVKRLQLGLLFTMGITHHMWDGGLVKMSGLELVWIFCHTILIMSSIMQLQLIKIKKLKLKGGKSSINVS